MSIQHSLIQTAIEANDRALAFGCLIEETANAIENPERIFDESGSEESFVNAIATDNCCDWNREELGTAASLILDDDEDDIWIGNEVAKHLLGLLCESGAA